MRMLSAIGLHDFKASSMPQAKSKETGEDWAGASSLCLRVSPLYQTKLNIQSQRCPMGLKENNLHTTLT